jgi:tetratricopeptide (TPR) repeat protein
MLESSNHSILEKKSEMVKDYKEVGRSCESSGNYKKAIESYSKALDIDPNNELIWHYLGHCYLKLEKYEKAINSLKIAIEINKEELYECFKMV